MIFPCSVAPLGKRYPSAKCDRQTSNIAAPRLASNASSRGDVSLTGDELGGPASRGFGLDLGSARMNESLEPIRRSGGWTMGGNATLLLLGTFRGVRR